MKIANQTPFPHLLFRTNLLGENMAAAVHARATFDIEQGMASISTQQIWPISPEPWQCAYGPMESDMVFKRGGVDVFVFGSAKAPQGRPVQKMDVRLKMDGKIDHTVAIFGDRVWENSIFGLRFSDPKPFSEMPLTLANAYGGWDEWDGLKFPCPNNALGKGFIWEKENAPGRALPNIEDPKNLIGAWSDKPHPVGFCAAPICEGRIKRSVSFDEKGQLTRIDPIFYNTAFPGLVIPSAKGGEKIDIHGVTAAGLFSCTLPDLPLEVLAHIGQEKRTLPMTIAQIGIEPDHNRLFITYSCNFNYTMEPLTKRSLEIKLSA